jgi:type II secretory pathway component PulC
VLKKYFLFYSYIVSSAAAVLTAVVLLIIINASVMKIPLQSIGKNIYGRAVSVQNPSAEAKADYDAIIKRNLFRAKLQAEMPVTKTEKQIEEERLTEIMKTMILKGVWLGGKKTDFYAVIDRGEQKGVWTYGLGEVLENGLVVSDIQRNSVLIKKSDFGARIKLFAAGFERVNFRTGSSNVVLGAKNYKTAGKEKEGQPPSMQQTDYSRDIRQEGNTVTLSKALADRIRADNNIVMSNVAVKVSVDNSGQSNGFQIVSIDRGSIAEKMGIVPNDIIQEVNGQKLMTSDDVKNAGQVFRLASKLKVKVLRENQIRTLFYEAK